MLMSNEHEKKHSSIGPVEISMNGISLEMCVQDGKKYYVARKPIAPGKYNLEKLDAAITFASDIAKGVSLSLTTENDIFFNGNIFGDITILNNSSHQKTNNVVCKSNIQSGAIVRTYPRVNLSVHGNVGVGAKIFNKERLDCNGPVEKATIKADHIIFDNIVSIDAEIAATKIEINKDYNRNFAALKEKFKQKCKIITEYTVAVEFVDQDDLAGQNLFFETMQASEQQQKTLDTELDAYAKSLEQQLLNTKTEQSVESFQDEEDRSKIFFTANQIHQNSEESLSDLDDDDELDTYIRDAAEIKIQLQKEGLDPNYISINPPQKKLNSTKPVNKAKRTFFDRKEEITARIRNFNAKALSSNQVVTSNNKIISLRKVQSQDLSIIESKFQHNQFAGLFNAATGTGKSIDILLALMAMTNNSKNFDLRVVIVTSRTILIQQLIAEFIKYYPNLGIGIVDGTHKKLGQHITLTTYPTLLKQLTNPDVKEKLISPDSVDVLILDEMHHGLAENFHPLIPKFKKNSAVFGYTASKAFNTLRAEGALYSCEQLLPLWNEYDVCKGIDNKDLSPCHNVIVNIHDRIDIHAVRNKNLAKNKHNNNMPEWADDYSDRDLAQKINVAKLNRVIVELIANGVNKFNGKRLINQCGIIFAAGIPHAKAIVEEINYYLKDHPAFKGKIPAAWVSGETNKTEKDRILADHEKGLIRILVGVDIFTEGYNCRSDEYSISARASLSDVMVIQRGGRDKRKCEELPDKVALTIDINYGIPQVFYHKFMRGHRSYGVEKVMKHTYEYDDLLKIPKGEVGEYTIDSEGFMLGKPCEKKSQLEVVTVNEPKLQTTFTSSFDDYSQYDIDDNFTTTLPEVTDLNVQKSKSFDVVSSVETSSTSKIGFFSNINKGSSSLTLVKSKSEADVSTKNKHSVTDMAFSMFQSQKRQRVGNGEAVDLNYARNSTFDYTTKQSK